MILYHVTPKKNLPSILKDGLIPMIGERSAKLNEEKGIFLFPSIQDMETALLQWLGDEFEDEEELVSLRIEISNKNIIEKTTDYEYFTRFPIPPSMIEYFRDE